MTRLLGRSGRSDAPTSAIVRTLRSNSAMSAELFSGMRHSFFGDNVLAADFLQFTQQLFGDVTKCIRCRTIFSGRRRPGVRGFSQAERQWQPAKERYSQSICGFFGSALAEGIAVLPAMRTLVAGHIFDDDEHRNAGLSKQIDGAPRIDQ